MAAVQARSPGGVAVGREKAMAKPGPAPRWRLGMPFLLLHVAALAAVFVGWSRVALLVGAFSYGVRTFGITAFYHRCFAHRSFRVPRPMQLTGAILGASAAQRGPLWWVSHHRRHHIYTDRPGDPHSPVVDGFWYSHVLWIFDPGNAATDLKRVPDLARFPELRLLDRFEYVVPTLTAAAAFGLGVLLGQVATGLGTNGPQMLTWGFVIPTIALYHSTFAVNSLAHRFGRRRYQTADASRNNWVIAALVLGEGWHNNHHRFPNSARHGIGRFELDPTWWAIRALAALGLASGLRGPPPWALMGARVTASVPLVDERLHGTNQLVRPLSGINVGPQASGLGRAGDGGAAKHYRDIGTAAAHFGDSAADRAAASVDRAGNADRQRASCPPTTSRGAGSRFAGHGLGQSGGGGVCPQLGHIETLPAQQVGPDGNGQAVELTGGGGEDDRPPPDAAGSKT